MFGSCALCSSQPHSCLRARLSAGPRLSHLLHRRPASRSSASTGARLKREAWQPLGSEPAQAVGLSNAGVAFLPLDATLKGQAAPRAIPQGERPGSLFLAATPDGHTLFISNEYGQRGNVGVISLHRDDQNRLTPATTAQLQTQFATPGITLSPDGTRLYALDEILPQGWPQKLPGHDISELQHGGCLQGPNGRAQSNGGLFVIDTAKAAALPSGFTPQQERDATLRLINAGCSQVRATVSSDARTLYVTARGGVEAPSLQK